ncbi:MAG: hypothetical protein CMN55_09260 [Sneathiella sp.]|jgi:hypothetical protein|uniref:hypothetical protein n=1 Tax=Sneathiella sp. TaxID=1964365 RepID=UPI000C51900E|nr:hypothetical protein [Sneathiella sp.]MAL79285.1 hypothetical protein [Sneathiella sp.]|tara:strand:- start:582 stop:1496 length:915 start_codon:yes stop_codon:yes gene_type:complete
MYTDAITHDPYAYLGRALMGDSFARYVPEESGAAKGETVAGKDGFGEDGFGFADFLDIINPLQHIPGLSTLYRELTGDEISPGSRMIGGTLYGGAIGFAASLVNSAIEEATGLDVGEHVVAFFSGEDETAPEGESDVLIADTPATNAPVENTVVALPADMTGNSLAGGAVTPALMSTADGTTPSLIAPFAPPASLKAPERAMPPATAGLAATEAAAHDMPGGLEWRGQKPLILQQVEQAKTPELTEEQLHAVFQSFRAQPPAAPGSPAISAEAASAAYQQRSNAMNRVVPAEFIADTDAGGVSP